MSCDCPPFGIRVLRIKYEMSWGKKWEDVQRKGLAEKTEPLKAGASQLATKSWHLFICRGRCFALITPLYLWGALCNEEKSPRTSKTKHFKGIDEVCVYRSGENAYIVGISKGGGEEL